MWVCESHHGHYGLPNPLRRPRHDTSSCCWDRRRQRPPAQSSVYCAPQCTVTPQIWTFSHLTIYALDFHLLSPLWINWALLSIPFLPLLLFAVFWALISDASIAFKTVKYPVKTISRQKMSTEGSTTLQQWQWRDPEENSKFFFQLHNGTNREFYTTLKS